MAAVSFAGVGKVYRDGTRALTDFTLDVADGEFMVFVGPSGCGKTTALRAVAGLEDITEGEVRIGDRVVNGLHPRHRDVAMVFQNYALYPHMSVYRNIAFSLKIRKTPPDEIRRRVEEAARILGLTPELKRKPGQLSGGQRQRVAMGRAIVREPKAFLMDEPLSNLDAKLRVGMRASLAQLHGRLGVTTVYVTHDQTEAMTLGQRVAVMRDGRIVQVDTPQRLYRDPVDLYVAGFIGTPAMNLVEARVEGGEVVFGSNRLALDPSRRPPPGATEIVLGIRPEGFEDAGFARQGLPALDATVTVLEELGADAHVFFNVDARPAGATKAAGADTSILADEGTLFTARVDPRTSARVGERITLAVDPARFHFFDPESGRSLVGTAAAEQPTSELAPAAG